MFLFIMILGLIFLIAGGGGLFYTFINVASGTDLWIIALIIFGTFTVFGIAILIFLALYNSEFA